MISHHAPSGNLQEEELLSINEQEREATFGHICPYVCNGFLIVDNGTIGRKIVQQQ